MSMIPTKSEELDEQVQAAEEALTAARRMPGGPERVAALRKAGQMRFEAYQRKWPANPASKTAAL
jgi:hypothetical protein